MIDSLRCVYLYAVALDEVDSERARAQCEALLSREEQLRHRRFVFERNRREFLWAHTLLRRALSRHAPTVAPESWVFTPTPRGRPEITGPEGAPPLHFSLSHTDGFITCAIARHPFVGVDVEATDGPGSTTEIAEHFFAPPEIAELRLISARQRRERFFQYWTLKESYIKARGAGLTLPLDQFWFSLLPGRPIEIRFARGFDDDPGRWRFALRRPSPRHQLAIALGGASDRPVTSIIDANWLCDL